MVTVHDNGDPAPGGFLEASFSDLLDRVPDAASSNYFFAPLNSGAETAEEVAAAMLGGQESAQDRVTEWYWQFLGRAPDPDSFIYFSYLLSQGTPFETVISEILGSSEYFADHGSTDTGFLDGLFEDVLNRAADPSGLSFYLNLLNNGASRQAVALDLMDSSEGLMDEVQNAYQKYLWRAADISGEVFYLNQLSGGVMSLRTLIASLVGSTEYVANRSGATARWPANSPEATPTYITVDAGPPPTTWAPGGSYVWDVDDATGSAGGEPGWSLLDVSTLDVTATADDPFTLVLATFSSATTPGPVPEFYYTNKGAGYYSWKIATASSISGFDPTAVAVDPSQFANFLGGGTFSVSEAASGQELDLTYQPYPCAGSDMAPPGYELTNYPAGGPPFTFVGVYLFYTNAHGLGGIQGTKADNSTMPCAWAYGPGLPAAGTSIGPVAVDLVNYTLPPIGTTNVTILAAKTTIGQDSVVNASAWDSCFDFQASFDPEVAIVTAGPSVQVQQVYAGLASAEHYVAIFNGNPGLTSLRLLVNGWTYNLGAVGQGQTVMVNVGPSFKPGSTNTVALLGDGPSGATADVVISDQPDGSLLAVTPTIQPPALNIFQQQGKIMVQWLAPANFFTLQGRASLDPATGWQDLVVNQQESQGWSFVTIQGRPACQLFRLRK